MSDYLNSVIYKLHKDDMSEIYIGSSKDRNKREELHKSACNNENSHGYNLKVYKFIRENGGMDTWKFEVIQEFSCENRTQLRILEQYYYDLMKPALNTIRPYISEEYYQDNIEEFKEKMKEYYQDNIEEFKEKRAKHYQDNRDEIIEKSLKRYRDNRDEIIEKSLKRYQDNIEEISKKRNQKCICECGKKYTFSNKARHDDSKRHKEFIENKEKTNK